MDQKNKGRFGIPGWGSFRSMHFKDWVFALHLLGRRERALLGLFGVLVVLGAGVILSSIYAHVTEEVPVTGGTFREGVTRAPDLINPLFLSSNDTDRDIVELVYSKLFSYDANGNIQPDLAKDYTISDDGKSYVVNLRENVTWHDGARFTAEDVIFTVKAIQDPSYKSALRPNWQGVTIELLGDYSVRFVLKQPYSPFLQNLALPILPRHIWGQVPVESAALVEANVKPVGTGPYVFDSLNQDSDGMITFYSLSRNTRYYQEGPHIANVEFKVFESEDEMIQAYKGGDIDGISMISARNADYIKSVGASVLALRMPSIFAVFFDESNPLVKDKNVRQALALAISKEELIKNVLGGGAIPIESPIPPGTFGYSPDISKTPYDTDQAVKILERSGWKDTNGDGIREKRVTIGTGKKAKTSLTPLRITLTTSDSKILTAVAEAIKGYWRTIGVDVEVKTLSINELEEAAIRPRKYDALLFGEILGHDPDPFAFWHSSQLKDPGLNIALYHSPAVDQLLETARKITDRDQIEQKYQQFQKIVDNDFPAIFLYSPTYFYAVRSNVRGMNIENVVLPSERFETERLWYMKTGRKF